MVKGSRPGKVIEPIAEETSETSPAVTVRIIEIPETISVKQLADLLQVSGIDIIKQLMRNGLMANINRASYQGYK